MSDETPSFASMDARTGFSELSRLHEGASAVVFRARRDADQRPVILKVPRGARPSAEVLARFEREHALTVEAAGAGVVRCLGWVAGAEPALVLEDTGAQSLRTHIADGPLPVADVVSVARSIATALERLHRRGITHCDVSPSNVVWNRTTGDVRLIDFGIARQQSRHEVGYGPVQRLLGTVAYMAPEQTGRMNRTVDARADLYGLGATLYHLLTGRPPFLTDDPLDLVYAILTRTPTPPRSLVTDMPPALSAMVTRLLAKNADDRYQSAGAFLSDLERLSEADDFAIGRDDHPPHLIVSERLHGRETELAAIRDAFERTRRGRSELLLLRGEAGIGKTRLVGEARPTLLRNRTIFLSGKFDQFHGGTPYSALLAGLGGFVTQLLAEPPAELDAWRVILREAVGDQGALLVEHLPDMELLIGPQPPVEGLPGHEAENRFALLCRRLLAALTARHQPLVVFLDDLQWADLPSVRLLRQLAADPDVTSTLFIGAYRDTAVPAGHPVFGIGALLRNAGASVTELALGPLDESDVTRLVDETLRHDPGAAVLGSIVYEKTRGNPFYVRRLLESLDADGLVTPIAGTGRWAVDLEAIRALPYSDNALDFLAARLGGLPQTTRTAVATGAVLGFEFRLRDLAAVSGLPLGTVARQLGPALDADVIRRIDQSLALEALLQDDLDESIDPIYRFAHDRLQQAAGELLAERERLATRCTVARLYRRRNLEGPLLFDLVEHALAARTLLAPEERRDFAELAVAAGIRAKNAAAFDASLRYLDGAWALLDGGDWDAEPELTRRIALEGGEAAYVAGDRRRMTAWIGEIIVRAKDPVTLLRAHEIAIQASVAHGELDDAIDRALQVLPLAGITLPRHPTRLDFLRGLVSTRLALRGHPPERLLDLPMCSDPVVLAAMRIQLGIMSATYYASPALVSLLAFTLVRLSVRHGIGPESPVGFNAWGYVCCVLNDLDAGDAYGRAAMALNERLGDRRLSHRAAHAYYTHVAFWKLPWRECRDRLHDVHRGCWDGGDVEYAAFAAFMASTMSVMIGDRLDEVAVEAARASAAIRSLGNQTALHQLEMLRQLIQCLVGDAPDATRLKGDVYDEDEMGPVHLAANDTTNLFCLGVWSGFLAYVMGDYERAGEVLRALDLHRDGATSSVFVPFDAYLDGLTHAVLLGDPSARSLHRVARRRARRALRRLRYWATHATENHEHRVALVEAELARAHGNDTAALDGYEKAISAARTYGWGFDVAIAAERAAHFHLDRGHDTCGRGYLLDARQHYDRWGARAKVARMDEQFTRILQGGVATSTSHATTRDPTLTGGYVPVNVDTVALLRASSALAKEVQLDGVVSALLSLTLESAGASRGVLFIVDREELRPNAEALADGSGVVVTPIEARRPDDVAVPQRVLSYVARTHKEIIIDDTRGGHAFALDAYFGRTPVRSALCLPIVQQQRLVALLYLEHTDATGMFSRERVAPVRALATQAAISIRNALLYESLEATVRERSRDLIAARQEAERERDRADTLLRNVLPEPIATELKREGRARPVHWPSATVMFTDFSGFTSAATRMSPEALVHELERHFSTFDAIMDEHGVEKLKTIGDSYMAVGGLPIRNDTHPHDVVTAALQIVDAVRAPRDGAPPSFGIRVGVHTGPLVAGVIGSRRLLYDVWGDTVNVASRIESAGEVGRVNVSAATYELIKDAFRCTPRGPITVRHLGALEMYFVDEPVPPRQADSSS